MKKIFIFLCFTVLISGCAHTNSNPSMVEAIPYSAGSNGYDVIIYNYTSSWLYCSLTATNGAWYNGDVRPHGDSGRMRINDPRATYNYKCNSK